MIVGEVYMRTCVLAAVFKARAWRHRVVKSDPGCPQALAVLFPEEGDEKGVSLLLLRRPSKAWMQA